MSCTYPLCSVPCSSFLPTRLGLREMRRILFCFCIVVLGGCMGEEDSSLLYEQGVSWELAEYREQTLEDISYDVHLRIPASIDEPITGTTTFHFIIDAASPQQVIIDFNQPAESVLSVTRAGNSLTYEVINNHIVIHEVEPGEHEIEVAFRAGDSSLNRNEEYLYTLFVPDRASFAIPLFDQPNLKARYRLSLEIPSDWVAVANGPLAEKTGLDGTTVYRFDETEPISTYLFSFAAGRFQTETEERDGRQMTMYHRETDREKVERNRAAVFDLHFEALSWLEDYTGIPHPFAKFDFVLIPSFQYGGMEHPGAILYRAASLFLDESATQNQYLGRASLIAHETAHMWFGDLVTMNWFDDVWTKEVFANFMAAKMVNPTFPDINHELRFLLRHYPSAYAIDRTAGANPIQQPLENLQMAGTLYGAIIYQKAPIVMRQLEQLIGEETLQEGLQVYLERYSFANATWDDLIAILDGLSDEDLRSWSNTWIKEPGRPHIQTILETHEDGAPFLRVGQTDPFQDGRVWNQKLSVMLGYSDSVRYVPVQLDVPTVDVDLNPDLGRPDFVIPNGLGVGYGAFDLDASSTQYILHNLPGLEEPLTRGIAWITLWDAVLNQQVAPSDFYELLLRSLPEEENELNIQRMLNYLGTTYWRLFTHEQRLAAAPALEAFLWEAMEGVSSTSLKVAYFNAFKNAILTPAGTEQLYAIWAQEESIEGLRFSDGNYTSMAFDLAVRDTTRAESVLDAQYERISNPDRKARFAFIRPALSPSSTTRDAFFESLAQLDNRSQEPWVLEAVRYLNHPLHAEEALPYLRPSLDLLQEIQETGDIFFPQRWLGAVLNGHQSAEAAGIVQAFLDEHPAYPYRLKNKILQSADGLYRAAEIVSGE